MLRCGGFGAVYLAQWDSSIGWIGYLVCATRKRLVRQAPEDAIETSPALHRWTRRIDLPSLPGLLGTQVCVLLPISIITRRLFVYGFSKWGLCMASDKIESIYFLHESEKHT